MWLIMRDVVMMESVKVNSDMTMKSNACSSKAARAKGELIPRCLDHPCLRRRFQLHNRRPRYTHQVNRFYRHQFRRQRKCRELQDTRDKQVITPTLQKGSTFRSMP